MNIFKTLAKREYFRHVCQFFYYAPEERDCSPLLYTLAAFSIWLQPVKRAGLGDGTPSPRGGLVAHALVK